MEQDFITGIRFMGSLTFFILAFIVALTNRSKVQSDVYNKSRWYFIAGMLALGIHNTIQFFGHFRETSVTTAWIINMMFYMLVVIFFNLGQLNLMRAGTMMKFAIYHSVGVYVFCLVLFAVGLGTDTLINDSKPLLTTTFIIAIIYICNLLLVNYHLYKDLSATKRLSNLTGQQMHERFEALRYTGTSMRFIMLVSLVSPLNTMSTSLFFNALIGTILFTLIIWHQVRFMIYGFNMEEVISVEDEIYAIDEQIHEEAEDGNNGEDVPQEIRLMLAKAIDKWVEEKSFTDPNMNLRTAVKQMDITANALNYYIEHNTDLQGYRQWIPYLRIEESKRLMIEHSNYTLDAVADMCGFSNGSALSRAFKAQEGISPRQWRDAHLTSINQHESCRLVSKTLVQ